MFLLGSTDSLVGSCFVFIAQTKYDTKSFLAYFKAGDTVVGKTGYLIEPSNEDKTLTRNSYLPLIDVDMKFEPAVIPQQVVGFNMETLPIQDTKMFYISGARVLFEKSYVEFGGCGGVQCDRLLFTGRSTKCGCLVNDKAPRFTITTKVTVHQINPENELFHNAKYCSWSLTKLLFLPMMQLVRSMRNSIFCHSAIH
jgi:hypothetical protein